MVSDPAGTLSMVLWLAVQLPDPEERVAAHSVVLPYVKLTVPVGVPEPGELELTVDEKATDCP